MALFDDLTKAAEKESTGGLIGKGRIETGYKAFVTGLGNRDSFFPCDYSNDADKKRAQALAKAKCTNGERSSLAIQIIVYKDFVKGRDVTWQDDRFFTYPLWTHAAKKIVIPSLKNANVTSLGEMWLRVGFADDPDGRTKKNQNNEDVVDKIAFVAEVYASEQAALAAVAGGDVAAENAKAQANHKGIAVVVPVAYIGQEQMWVDFITPLKSNPAISGKPAPVVMAFLKKTYPDESQLGATYDELLKAVTS